MTVAELRDRLLAFARVRERYYELQKESNDWPVEILLPEERGADNFFVPLDATTGIIIVTDDNGFVDPEAWSFAKVSGVVK